MPKAKTTAAPAAGKKPRGIKKTAPKTIRPKKKARSVLVDVIEDDPIEETVWESPASESAADNDGSAREDLDKQKHFYEELAKNMQGDDQEVESDGEAQPSRRVGLYRNMVWKFLLLIVLIGGAVAYFSFSQLKIALTLKGETLSNNLLLRISGSAAAATTTPAYGSSAIAEDPREDVSGTVKTVEVNVEATYPATGETYLGDEIAGQVRIINNYNKNQPLVATTRLLTPDNKLFRLKEAVNVPAGGEVTVAVYADKPSADMAIAPTSFTIPGLWAGLQDKIYAKSDEAFVFTKKVRKYVNASDLELAAKDINQRMIEAAKKEAEASLGTDWLYQAEGTPTITMDAKMNDQKDEFAAKAKGKIIAVSFDKPQAASLAQAKLNLVIPDGKELANFDPDRISYSLESYDAATQTATVKAVFSGTMILAQDSSIIDPRQLVNLSADQIGAYLRDRPEVKEYQLEFSPSFIKKAPGLADRIKVEIKKD